MSTETDEILAMLSYKRPKGSATEREFRTRFLSPLGVTSDKFGNLSLRVGPEDSKVCWASHTDSVHKGEGRQKIELNGNIIGLHKKSKSSCLGADDASGVWLMMEMIRAKVPGLYVFHYGEEHGGIGSRAIVTETPEFVKGIKAIVSFDRMGKDSIITHQGGTRTCSDNFANSMADQLMPNYKIDTTGSYTDSKEYRGIVSECTNVSVGYYNQHSSREIQDVDHLIKLRNRLVLIDASRLVFEREPKIEAKTYGSSWGGGYGAGYTAPWRSALTEDSSLEDLLWAYPKEAARVIAREMFLEQAGLNVADFREMISAERQSDIVTRIRQRRSGQVAKAS